jgi:hypothetical protein
MTVAPNIVRIVGGLGNQLFQYAFGLHLEAQTARPSRFDTRPLESYRLHGGKLAIEGPFDVRVPVATDAELRRHGKWLEKYDITRAMYRLSKTLGRAVPLHTDYNLPGKLSEIRKPSVFHGYWQTPVFASEALSRLSFRNEILEQVNQIFDDHGIDPDSDVVIHVRRGDFLKLPKSCHLPLGEQDYYAPIMQSLEQNGRRRFLILSDDIEALRRGPLAEFNSLFVDSTISLGPAVDLCLLSRMRTMVLSASSFSWWAAALNVHRDPLVLAPHPWVKLSFRDDPHASALPCSNWILVDTVPVQTGRGYAQVTQDALPEYRTTAPEI